MNNSKFEQEVNLNNEEEFDRTPILRSQETECLKIIEAIDEIKNSPAWITLKKYIFDGLVESFDKKLRTEKNKDLFTFIQGQQDMALRYSDFDKFAEVYRNQLTNIRKQING